MSNLLGTPGKITPTDLADTFDQMERMGAETDEPEGSRYVQISDTLARMIAGVLRGLDRVEV